MSGRERKDSKETNGSEQIGGASAPRGTPTSLKTRMVRRENQGFEESKKPLDDSSGANSEDIQGGGRVHLEHLRAESVGLDTIIARGGKHRVSKNTTLPKAKSAEKSGREWIALCTTNMNSTSVR